MAIISLFRTLHTFHKLCVVEKGEEREGEGGKKRWRREKRKKAERKKGGIKGNREKERKEREERKKMGIKEEGRLLTKYIFIQQFRIW